MLQNCFLRGFFLLVFLTQSLSKCSNSTKLPLPWKISGSKPAPLQKQDKWKNIYQKFFNTDSVLCTSITRLGDTKFPTEFEIQLMTILLITILNILNTVDDVTISLKTPLVWYMYSFLMRLRKYVTIKYLTRHFFFIFVKL